MKSKVILLIATAAVATLSFTFASTREHKKEVATTTKSEVANAPAGGFALEEK